ncbi:uncharacterized protein LOC131955000 [Physella acuta]|uniref:uncharacterized protein LOC131955000 n=1 Tax=Physella acuta TaxID=109671 RepID=UPI0027DABD0D|nr:uncharacterized protein LOC131955000 [Physella acuta]
MSGETKKDIRTEARNFSASLTNVFLLKRRDPQSKNLLEKAQQLIEGLLAETPRPVPATPPPRATRGGAGMGQLWVKLDELKRENDDLKRQRARSSDEKAGSPKSPKSPKFQAPTPGQIEAVTSDLQRARAENETLKSQIEKLQKTLKEHQTVNSNLRDDCKRSKAALEAAQKSAMKAREDTKKMEASLQTIKAENDILKQKSSQQVHSTPTKPPVSSPKPRARTDNRMTENISERCRPSNIAVAYTTLESQEWMDAKEHLEDNSCEEDVATQHLCDILMSSYSASCAVLKSVEKIIAYILANPTSALTMLGDRQVTEQLPEDLADLVCQKLRASADNISTRDLSEVTKSKCNCSALLSSTWSSNSIQKYVSECGALTWQMAIQRPAMKLLVTDARFDESKHKLWWSCNQAQARKIDYFIWPVLYDYEGGNLMVKGCVHAS